MPKEELDFKTVSELASEVERKGNYDYAIELWKRAATLARKSWNIKWCEDRAAFLARWGVRMKDEVQ